MPYGEGETQRKGLSYDTSELLNILRAEREQSVGFDYDATLNADRERALNYYKGEMGQDMPVLPNRSAVVSTDVADAIETALPDLIDVFLAGEDGMTFQATGQEDEEQAKQETDYVRHVIFQQNRGFTNFYTAFKDALLMKTGVWKVWWEAEPEYQEYETHCDEGQLQELEQMGVEITGIEPLAQPEAGETEEPDEMTAPHEQMEAGMGLQMFKVTARKMIRNGQVMFAAWPPEDFTVSNDTVTLADAPYCAARRKTRVQDLLNDGYDEDDVMLLREDETSGAEIVEQARDIVGEHSETDFNSAAIDMLKQVEVVEHFIRVDLEKTGKPQIWRIVTGNNETVLLDIEKRARIEFASICPYPQTHRFYGQSVADKTIEIQKWKTALIRMLNDSGYFANNQRQEVNVDKATEDTIPALIDNTPGRPVPTKGGALNPIQSAPPAFDMLGAIEFANTVSEQRTGIVRNAQGLNPDTLHDTAAGAKILIGAAQKRIRMMARQFAEGGVRDLYLLIHDLLRSNATMKDTIRLRNTWVEVDPQSWGRRKDVAIEIGVGSGGREEKMVKFNLFADRIGQLVEMQGGMNGPLVTMENIYALADAMGDALDIKNPERFITDPAKQDPNAQQGEEPSPEAQAMMAKVQMEQQKAQADMQLKQQTAQADAVMKQQQAQVDMQMQAQRDQATLAIEQQKMELQAQAAQQKMQFDAQAAREKAALEIDLARQRAAAEYELAQQKMQQEMQLARERADLEAQLAVFTASNDAQLKQNRPGGDLDK